MSIAQFEHLSDYSNLSHLHLYGDFLEIYNLEIEAPLAAVGQLFQELKALDRSIFTTYVTFVLAKAGYDIEQLSTIVEDPQFTSSYSQSDWPEFCNFYETVVAESPGADLLGSWARFRSRGFQTEDTFLRNSGYERFEADNV